MFGPWAGPEGHDGPLQRLSNARFGVLVSVQAMKEMIGPYKDIPGPEVSTSSRVMAWIFDEYSKYKGFSPQCVTGDIFTASAGL